jgi:uncharacterized protein YfaS (alpha-2-macroglobulin family)
MRALLTLVPLLSAAALSLLPAGQARAQRSTYIPPLYLPPPVEQAEPGDTAAQRVDTLGLRIHLAESPSRAAPRATIAPALLLNARDAGRILARLPALPPSAAAADSFAFPARTLPAPRTGRVVLAAWPPADSIAPPRPDGPNGAPRTPAALAIVRGAPQGDVPVGAEVTVTFSQAMVPLGSVGEVESRPVPVRLSPMPPGSWRWLDVRTLVFTPRGEMQRSTEYTVSIPAGTRSEQGGVLAQDAGWTFRTQLLSGIGGLPQGHGIRREPLILIQFDQRIDRIEVSRRVQLRVGRQTLPVRPATAAEIAADPNGRSLSQRADTATWIALRPVQPLPYDAEVAVVVPAGTPSAEGPLPTRMEQQFTFHTYGPLRVTGVGCQADCRPGMPLVLGFTNPLDTAAFDPAWVRVTPAIPGMTVQAYGSTVVVGGRTLPRTSYTVTVAPLLRDVFGQTLGRAATQRFRVGLPYPELTGLGERMMVMDPAGPRRLSVFSHDHPRLRLRIHRVRPEDWKGFNPSRPYGGAPAPLPGTQAVDRVVRPGGGPGEMVETVIDLDEVLRGGPGQLVVAVEGMDGEGNQQGAYSWVQVTEIGLTAFGDRQNVTAWATSLVDGAPLSGVSVRVEGGGEAATGADGTATLPVPGEYAAWMAARRGDDVALLPGGWRPAPAERSLIWYTATDRNLYRPGEEVRFKGWVRRFERTPTGGVRLPERLADSVTWRARDPRGNDIAQGRAPLTELGGFDAGFTLPAGANLGYAQVEVQLPGPQANPGYVSYQVQEFRRPEYEVAAQADEGPHVVGGSAEVSVRASYFSGGSLPGAPVSWDVSTQPGWFTPPGWGEWRFGVQSYGFSGARQETFRESFAGQTDVQGRHAIRVHFDRAEPPRAHTVTANATVLDVNRQPWSTSQSLLVHPAELYVGMRTEHGWIQAGEPIGLSVAVVDLEGKPAAGQPVEVVATRLEWRSERGRWSEVATDSARCAVVSGAEPTACTFATAPQGGRYRIAATVRDARERPSITSFDVWAYGSSPWTRGPGQDTDNPERRATLVPDREAYAPGDTARVLVQLPFWPARGVLTIRREGLVRTENVASDGPTFAVSVPIGEQDIPNLHLQVDLVGANDAAGNRQPTARGTDFASGSATLAVPPGPRTLTVEATPADSVLVPDAPTSVDVQVRDAAGRPVPGAEVALVVVDEAVLALTGYHLRNPIELFYPQWMAGVSDAHLRSLVMLDDSAAADEVRGTVVDARTRQPVPGAVVRVKGTRLAAATDAAGRFRLARVPRGVQVLEVTRIGFNPAAQPVTVGAEPLAEVRIELSAQALMLESIVVTGASTLERRGRGEAAAIPAPPPPSAPPAPPAAMEPQSADFAGQGKAAGADGADGAGPAIAMRENFAALALWAPVVRTDADGHARVPFTLPSNLTRYRVMAVAVAGGTHYGAGESAITARQPLMVRPSAPRFLNYGDRFDLPVIVQNQTDAAVTVDVAVRGEGIRFAEPGKRVRIPANDRVEVRIAGEAVAAGTATVQVAAAGGTLSDAATITLPVYTPATAEAFATYGSIAGDSAVTLPLQVPGAVIPAYGGLEVTTSSTALQELTDAFLFLVHYPFDCAEQISSRLMAIAALRDVLTEFRAEGMPQPQALAAGVAADLARLQTMQTGDGGFGFWPGDRESWPYVSVHVAHSLVRIRGKGYEVPGQMLDRSMSYLRTVERSTRRDHSPGARLAIRAYAAYVRDLAGDPGVERELRALFGGVGLDTIPLEVGGWLLSAVAGRPEFAAQKAELLRIINNRATETASTATFTTAYEEGEYLLLHSSRRTDGVVLEALLRADPNSELATKTVRGLLGHRVRGRWSNTQENAWVLLALDRYFRVYEGQTPEFVARLWLGERFAGEQRFAGRSADRIHLDVPMRVLVDDDPESLTIGKEGPGRLYYRAGLRYAPSDLDLTPMDRGFAVERTYEPMDDPGDVVRGEDGRWRVRAGARVRITVTMTAPSRRVHVALVDPLPAGFEAVNTTLLGNQAPPPRGETVRGGYGDYYDYMWRWRWYEHQNTRDDRVEAFASLLPAGVYTYSYEARATTPGLFIVPPPRAEEMYSPETFGRGATERVIVEEDDGRE